MKIFFDPNDYLESRYMLASYELFSEFILEKSPRYIFGRTCYGDSVAKDHRVLGFVDDFTDETEHMGLPIIRSENLPTNAIVLSSVVGRPWTVKKTLDSLGVKNFDYFSYYRFGDKKSLPVKFQDVFTKVFNENIAEYEGLYSRLSDSESKKQFQDIVNFRLSDDLSFMTGYKDIQDRQYFEEFLGLNQTGEIFCDVGCFDGFTTKEFIARCPNYKAIYVFEPEKSNMQVVRANLSQYKNIEYCDVGLSEKSEIVNFEPNGSGSRISESGSTFIKLEALNGIVHDDVTFIKMDIEGGELSALRGSSEIIRKHRPKLAIACYHKVNDFLEISQYVLSLNPEYKIYLRHYTEGVDETVMYFI